MLRTLTLGVLLGASISAGTVVSAEGPEFRLEGGQTFAAGVRKDAGAFAIRALGCDDLQTVHISGVAQAVVNGTRHSSPMKLRSADTPGVYTVSTTTDLRNYLAHLTATCPATGATASALVSVQGYRFTRDATVFLTRAATSNEVELALNRTMSAVSAQALATPAR
jgi:hypothetical protein